MGERSVRVHLWQLCYLCFMGLFSLLAAIRVSPFSPVSPWAPNSMPLVTPALSRVFELIHTEVRKMDENFRMSLSKRYDTDKS